MDYRLLGNTGLRVSALCFGTLPMGPLQAGVSIEQGAAIIRRALDLGVNYIDTAQMYKTYPHIRNALKDYRGNVVISSKTVSCAYEDMRNAIDEALTGMGICHVDIMYLHAARTTPAVFTERAGALKCLADAKREGLIRAAGISTHSVEVVRAAGDVPDIDVIMPIINMAGVGIIGGDLAGMMSAVDYAVRRGKAVVAQKALAGGHLIERFDEAVRFVLDTPGVSSIAVGMVSLDEVEADVAVFEGRPVAPAVLSRIGKNTKSLMVQSFCKGCRACEKACPSGAIKVADGRAVVDHDKCVLCGYCCPVCPEFNIRLA
ncbi:MAG: aldo/keto reductase [Ignavibacteriales bacterium]